MQEKPRKRSGPKRQGKTRFIVSMKPDHLALVDQAAEVTGETRAAFIDRVATIAARRQLAQHHQEQPATA